MLKTQFYYLSGDSKKEIPRIISLGARTIKRYVTSPRSIPSNIVLHSAGLEKETVTSADPNQPVLGNIGASRARYAPIVSLSRNLHKE